MGQPTHAVPFVTEEDASTSCVLVVRRGPSVVATMALATTKPWAIDLAYFTAVPKALLLRAMAMAPEPRRQGIGLHVLELSSTPL